MNHQDHGLKTNNFFTYYYFLFAEFVTMMTAPKWLHFILSSSIYVYLMSIVRYLTTCDYEIYSRCVHNYAHIGFQFQTLSIMNFWNIYLIALNSLSSHYIHWFQLLTLGIIFRFIVLHLPISSFFVAWHYLF